MTLLLHRGGESATLDDLRAVPLPEETETYKPVSHYDLAVSVAELAGSLLRGYTLEKGSYGLARDGNQLFSVLTYRNGISSEMGLSIGFRNSYDKSLSVGIAVGASVFVCDNLALTGQITIMRKHTVGVISTLEDDIITTVFRSQNNFHRIYEDSQVLKAWDLSDDDAYKLTGLLYGRGILTPRQLPVVKREWQNPSHEDFADRNAWSFYNAVTEALKTSPPNQIMERHIALHRLLAGGER